MKTEGIKDTFKFWLNKNIDEFNRKPEIEHTYRDVFILKFEGIIDEIALCITENSILLNIYDPTGKDRDTITDLLDWFKHDNPDIPKEMYEDYNGVNVPTKELWKTHLFDYIRSWSNRELQPDRYLFIHACKKDMPFVSYISDIKGIIEFRKRLISSFREKGTEIQKEDYCFSMSVVKDKTSHSESIKENDYAIRRKSVIPLGAFRVTSDGNVIEVNDDFEDSKADDENDKSLFVKAALIDAVVYVIANIPVINVWLHGIGSTIGGALIMKALCEKKLLLRKAKWNIINEIHMRNPDLEMKALANIRFINEAGNNVLE